MITGFGYGNVVANVYAHKLLKRIATSSYGDRSNFVYVIADALIAPYSLLGLQKIAATTCSGS